MHHSLPHTHTHACVHTHTQKVVLSFLRVRKLINFDVPSHLLAYNTVDIQCMFTRKYEKTELE